MPTAADKSVPGVDQGSVMHEGKAFVVWSDFPGGGGSNSSSNVNGMTCNGRVHLRDGRQVEFYCATKDGKAGPVTIDRATYDLADGNLFLISQDGDRLRVKQLKRPMRDLEFTREKLEAFARQDKELVAFFSKTGKPD
jgi:hypothetical protein